MDCGLADLPTFCLKEAILVNPYLPLGFFAQTLGNKAFALCHSVLKAADIGALGA